MTATSVLAVVARAFRRHLLIFVAFLAALVVLGVAGLEWRWASWPVLIWSLLLLLHYLLHKSTIVDERWAEERVEELNLKSYDRGHIENIRERPHGDKR